MKEGGGAQQLQGAAATAEDAVARIRAFLERVTQAESERKPDPSAWSIGEIAHHLVLVIRRAGVRCREIATNDPPDRFDYSAVVAARRFTLPDVADVAKSGKGTAPAPVVPTPGGDIRKLSDDLQATWAETQAALRLLQDGDLSRYYYEHYRLGPLNLYEYIAFQGYHALKHLAQMQRTLAQVRYDENFALIDDARGKVLGLLDTVTQDEADRRPAPEGWSVSEIAHHISLWERDSMTKLAEMAATAKPHEHDYAEVLKKRPWRLEDSWDITITGKGTHLPEWTPTQGTPLNALQQDLQAARAHTKRILVLFRDQDLGVRFVMHRRLGPLTVYERMAFAAYHDLKHLKQMERTLARVRAAPNPSRSEGIPMTQDGVTRNRERYDRSVGLLDDARSKVLVSLRSVTQVQADRRPAENEWSVGEIAHHLALTEREIMGQVANLAATAKPNEYEYDEVVKKRAFRIEDAWDVSVTGKAEAPPQLIPTAGKPLPELLRGLDEARAHTKQLLGPYRDQDLGVRFFVHRRFGPMTLYERLAFTAYHDLKHLKQMERALARVKA